ncbi:MAG: hypothetical protein LBB78_01485, partial [Spirochaetaceae bacterium]|nr:hypothetical protein [Spirochaetaceae bacterium]
MEERIKMMLPLLDEKQRRSFLASEALAYGYGGIAMAQRLSGMSKNTMKNPGASSNRRFDGVWTRPSNQKMLQVGAPNPHRNEQFEYINSTAQEYIDQGEPVISVDTKKKENIGNFKSNGQEYRLKKDPRKVLDHDFPLEALGKIAPYGVYNVNKNIGFVNVGTSHDTSEFAVESIARWWETVG